MTGKGWLINIRKKTAILMSLCSRANSLLFLLISHLRYINRNIIILQNLVKNFLEFYMDLFGIDKFLKEVLYKLVDERTKEIKDKADKTAAKKIKHNYVRQIRIDRIRD
jgi:hypothetical protein